MIRSVFIASIIFLCFTACRSTRKIQTVVTPKDTASTTATKENTHQDTMSYVGSIYDGIKKKRIDFTSFSAKVDVDYSDGEGKKYDVNAHIRMQKDSVIWISITAIFGIEGLRAYITRDSVKLLNKQDKIYTARSVEYLQEMTALPLDLPTLQDLLIGNPVFLDSNIVSYSRTGEQTTLLSLGEFFKNLFTIDASSLTLQSSKLDDMDELRNRTCFLTYEDYENKKGVNFSVKRLINVTEKKNLDIKLNFKQYAFNETLSFPFSIPKNYKTN